jgi:hypothetical protein
MRFYIVLWYLQSMGMQASIEKSLVSTSAAPQSDEMRPSFQNWLVIDRIQAPRYQEKMSMPVDLTIMHL